MNRILLLCFMSFFLLACEKEDVKETDQKEEEQQQDPEPTFSVVKMNTAFGDIYIWLFEETPVHRENFLALTDSGFYNGTTFHRVIDNFMIQGGDPNSKDDNPSNDGMGGPGYTLPAEFIDSLKHDMGVLGAARTNNPEKRSSGSQFYIVESESGAHHLDGQYTVFGKVIEGMDVVHEIASQETTGNNDGNRPLTDIPMVVTIVEKTADELETDFGFKGYKIVHQ